MHTLTTSKKPKPFLRPRRWERNGRASATVYPRPTYSCRQQNDGFPSPRWIACFPVARKRSERVRARAKINSVAGNLDLPRRGRDVALVSGTAPPGIRVAATRHLAGTHVVQGCERLSARGIRVLPMVARAVTSQSMDARGESAVFVASDRRSFFASVPLSPQY